MKFDYKVKFNGVYYMAGEEVPMDGKTPSVGISKPTVEAKAEPMATEVKEEPKKIVNTKKKATDK